MWVSVLNYNNENSDRCSFPTRITLFYSARLDIYFTPALFPRYLYFEKEEVDMAKAFDIRNPSPTVVPYELKLTETYERYIPFDTLFLAVLFFGLAFRKVQKPKKFN